MSYLRATIIRALIGTLLIIGSHVSAETIGELNAKLDNYNGNLEKSISTLNILNSRLLSYESKLANAKEKAAESEENLSSAQKRLNQPVDEKNPEAKRIQEQHQKRLKLAEHGLQATRSRLQRVLRKKEELQKEAETSKTTIHWLNKKIEFFTTELASQKKQENEFRQAKDKADKERIANRLAEIDKAKMEAATLSSTSSTLPPPVIQESTEQKPVIAQSKTKMTPKQRFAQKEMDRLYKNTNNSDKSEKRHYLELLLEIDRKEVVELEYLGNNHFYTEIKLNKGKHKLSINLRQFIAKVPESEDGDTYVVIYDATNKRDSRFVIFNKNLLM